MTKKSKKPEDSKGNEGSKDFKEALASGNYKLGYPGQEPECKSYKYEGNELVEAKKSGRDNEPTVARALKRQHSTAEKNKPKVALLEVYRNFLSKKDDILTTTTVERLANELVDWAYNNPYALRINDFLQTKGIERDVWDDWRHKYPDLAAANRMALMVLGNRRERGLMERKFEPGSTNFMMPHYDKDWREMIVWKSDLSKKEDTVSGIQVVYMEPITNSPLVPDKKDE